MTWAFSMHSPCGAGLNDLRAFMCGHCLPSHPASVSASSGTGVRSACSGSRETHRSSGTSFDLLSLLKRGEPRLRPCG